MIGVSCFDLVLLEDASSSSLAIALNFLFLSFFFLDDDGFVESLGSLSRGFLEVRLLLLVLVLDLLLREPSEELSSDRLELSKLTLPLLIPSSAADILELGLT